MEPEAKDGGESWVTWIEPDESIPALAMVKRPPPMAIRTPPMVIRTRGLEWSRDDGDRFGLALKKYGIRKSHLAVVLKLSHAAPGNWERAENGPGREHFDVVMDIMNGDQVVIEAIKARIRNLVLAKYDDSKDTKMLLDTNFENNTGHVRVDKVGNSTQGHDGMVEIPVRITRDQGGGKVTVTESVLRRAPASPIAFVDEKQAYGLFIAGNSMWPALRHGNIAWIDPLIPPTVENEAVLYQEYGIPGDLDAIICWLVSYDENNWTIATFKPEYRERKISRKDYPICHYVIERKNSSM